MAALVAELVIEVVDVAAVGGDTAEGRAVRAACELPQICQSDIPGVELKLPAAITCDQAARRCEACEARN